MINVIIADDHKIVVDGLVSILEDENDINVVGTALEGNGVLKLLKDHDVHVAILDIEMPGLSGIQLSEIISDRFPKTKILILTMYKSQDYVKRIISSGAKGYILKNKGSDELVKAIRYINKGESYIGQEITDVLIEALKEQKKKKKEPKFQLTKREKEVLSLIAEGKSSVEMSKILFIAPSTIDTHRRNLLDKIGLASSKELIIFALNNRDILD